MGCAYDGESRNSEAEHAAKKRRTLIAAKKRRKRSSRGPGRPRRPIYAVNLDTGAITHFESISAAAKAGFNLGSISACLHRRNVQHHGFLWFYLQQPESVTN